MFIAAWNVDLQWGSRDEALKLMKEFDVAAHDAGWRGKHTRVLVGSIGAPESRVVIQHEFETLSDLEASWDGLHKSSDVFRKWVTSMKPNVVPGSARWEIYRVLA